MPLALRLGVGGFYTGVLDRRAEDEMSQVNGQRYVLAQQVIVTLSVGHFAKLDVALLVSEEEHKKLEGGHGGATPPEGFGPMEQEAVVRDVITDELTDSSRGELVHRKARRKPKKKVLKALHEETDVEITEVLFTDVAVQ